MTQSAKNNKKKISAHNLDVGVCCAIDISTCEVIFLRGKVSGEKLQKEEAPVFTQCEPWSMV